MFRMLLVLATLLDVGRGFLPAPAASVRPSLQRSFAARVYRQTVVMAEFRPAQPIVSPLSAFLGGLFGGILDIGNRWAGSRGEQRAELKAQLFKAVNMNQGKGARELVESILEQLIALEGPIEKREKLPNLWRLIWSSQTADAFSLALPSSVLGGVCFQRITAMSENSRGMDGMGGQGETAAETRVENLVIWPFLGGLTLNGGASLEAVDDTRSILRIDSFALELGSTRLPLLELTKIAPVSVRDAPVVKQGSQLVTLKKVTSTKLILVCLKGAYLYLLRCPILVCLERHD